jgi:hypothetical protein
MNLPRRIFRCINSPFWDHVAILILSFVFIVGLVNVLDWLVKFLVR